ncbi:probable aromatic amino acid aminotransferase 1 [Phialocephala subalpina]|uniref:Probable aromatic amino acid aminotransferase 1 n=1 Tax=Phialocephala subalpina TaxID=576137 RepID=A0A1L7WVH5_9HELO|nr:probable aromatic amino acid aminotransferase 1 [Phialocephala subalpina]
MADFEYVNAREAKEDTGPKPPLDFSHHLSRVTASRKASSIKSFYKYFQIPGIGNLAGGLPNAALFPFDTLEAQIAQPERWTPTPNLPNDPSKDLASQLEQTKFNKNRDVAASIHMTVPHTSAVSDLMQKIDLTTALQYGTAQGYPPLYSYLRQFTREVLHPNIPYKGGADIILTVGNTDGLSKALECFTNNWSEERDWIRERPGILVEEFAYMNAVQGARPRGLQIVPVKIDLEGMLPTGPGGLEDVLENWDESKGKRPHLMYTVTIGQNPTSGTLSIPRRKDIYALCSKYDVLIIEDDPYWYLQFPSAAGNEAMARNQPPPPPQPVHTFGKKSGYDFIDSLVPSYLNVDYDGRVIRLDTFSKTVAPGCRVGWITAQPAIIERILRITESSTQQPSGFVQSMLSELLIGAQPAMAEFSKKSRAEQFAFSGWKTDGWVRWLAGLRGIYERRMNRMCNYLEEGRFLVKQGTPTKSSDADWAVISKTKMYSFDWPRAGMFVWVQMHFESHPLFGQVAGPKMATLLWIYLTTKPYSVLASPGAMFSPTDEIREKEGWKYFRLCFAAVSEEEVEKSSKRLTAGIRDFWLIKDKKELEDIEDEDEESVEGRRVELLDLGSWGGC